MNWIYLKKMFVLCGFLPLIILLTHSLLISNWNRIVELSTAGGGIWNNGISAGNDLDRMREKIVYEELLMDPLEVDVILRALKGRKSYIEWGSGGSTLNFPQFISGEVVSIEHDRIWCKGMPKFLRKKRIRNVKLYCVNTIGQNGREGRYATFKSYIDKIKTFNTTWDFVLIDGRARVAASIRALSYIHQESAVLVHDFERVLERGDYDCSEILKYYDVIERVGNSVEPNTGTRGMAHLRRKEGFNYLEGQHGIVQDILDKGRN